MIMGRTIGRIRLLAVLAGVVLLAAVVLALVGIHGHYVLGQTPSGAPAPDAIGYDDKLGLRFLVFLAGVVLAAAMVTFDRYLRVHKH